MKVGEIWQRNDLVKSILLEKYILDEDRYLIKWWYDNNGEKSEIIVKGTMARIYILKHYKKAL